MKRHQPILVGAFGLAACAGSLAQDSVATQQGGNDAIAHNKESLQRVRYVVDLVTIPTSWDNRVMIGPVVKATRDADPMFNTMVLGAGAISPDHEAPVGGVTFPEAPFALWTQPGQGVNPQFNAASGTIAITGYDRQFAVAHSDFTNHASNIVGAVIGQNADEPQRLYVERIIGAISGLITGPTSHTGTLSLGGVDRLGNVFFRAEDFNADPAFPVKLKGDNLVRVTLPVRRTTGAAALNILLNLFADQNEAFDAQATSFVANNTTITVNPPVGLVDTVAPTLRIGQLFGLDFEGRFVAGRDVPTFTRVLTHRASGVLGLRGNPSVSASTVFGGNAGVFGALAVTAGERASAINVCALRFNAIPTFPIEPVPDSPRLLSMPAPISGPGGFTANSANDAEFHQWLSQVAFRGPCGQVGLGQTDGGRLVAAATAKDSTVGEFIAVASVLPPPSTEPATWTIAARSGQAVLSGPDDGPGPLDEPVVLGALITAQPTSLSSPAVDLLGNVYFVGRWQPDGGDPATGLFKAVNTAQGYQLELLLTTGQEILGANSGTPYIVSALTLVDADSIASGAFHQGQVLQSMLPGHETTDESSMFAMGGVVVNATIAYQRQGGQIEEYEAMLFVGPAEEEQPPCPGDTNGDGMVNFADLNAVIAAFNTSDGDPAYTPDADLDQDGEVDFADLNVVLNAFNGDPCF